MDAFFASVEQRDFPELIGKSVAVGGSRERGVVAAASYEARKYGVKSAMSSKMAYLKCPHIIFQKPRFEVYKEVSNVIQSVFYEYTDLVEPLSLDEAFLDVTENKKGIDSATEIANEIRSEILKRTQLTASAGVSINKFVAKLASDVNKPNGICVVKPHRVNGFIEQLEIKRFFGVGKVTAAKFHKMGIIYGKDMLRLSEAELIRYFGKQGKHYFNIARGIDNRVVNPDRVRKSLGAESTFDKNIFNEKEVKEKLEIVCERVWKRLLKSGKTGRTVTVKAKYSDFTQITRSLTLESKLIENKEVLMDRVLRLSNQIENLDKGIRLLGVTVSNFEKSKEPTLIQLTLDF